MAFRLLVLLALAPAFVRLCQQTRDYFCNPRRKIRSPSFLLGLIYLISSPVFLVLVDRTRTEERKEEAKSKREKLEKFFRKDVMVISWA